MTSVLFEGSRGSGNAEIGVSAQVSDASDFWPAAIEKNLDRTSDAFVDALNLLERCLPRSFGA